MHLSDIFVPTAANVGVLSMVVYFFMLVAMYAFLANLIFTLTTHNSIVPEHRITRVMGAIIAAVAGLSYYFIQDYYRHMLADLSALGTEAERQELIRTSYNAIGQYRYMDWAVTTPLLLLKMVSMLRVESSKAKGAITALLLADFFMVLTGYIGEQQLDAAGHILVGPKLFWGAVSTVGYLVVPFVLYRLWNRFKDQAKPIERKSFKIIALSTVTTWGVYPLGYVLSVLDIDMNWIHLSFSVADIINKVGLSVVVYLAGKTLLDERVPKEATQPAYQIN
ncbi:bacteriorhodopsin [Hymenobacter profundi]|uniref:Bacteriorhodopsin n=1 Tax=Hymenobacter profundi TaxID=1982110 RepID=A0ABS6WYA7_9BACT|nr:bacteriorhodopsin [Hymenobacter profundi]MBW3128587.1 bacteriorhodopsin [Hymenobacter profundi]